MVFGSPESLKAAKIHENALPVSVLASMVLASVAAPFLPKHVGQMVLAQARKPKPVEETIGDTPQVQPRLARSHTVSGGKSGASGKRATTEQPENLSDTEVTSPTRPSQRRARTQMPRQDKAKQISSQIPRHPSIASLNGTATPLTSASLQDVTLSARRNGIRTASSVGRMSPLPYLLTHPRPPSPDTPLMSMTHEQKVHLLRSHYFRSETQFLTALEGISNRLVILPKPARLSALRAELALIARDLPAEVDIPLLCPPTLLNGIPSKSKHHRIVRLNPAEATSLNSAERVPYLLMIEVLREDFDFNPDSQANQRLLGKLTTEKKNRRRLFDITAAARHSIETQPPPIQSMIDSVYEPDLGDLASPDLRQESDEFFRPRMHNGMVSDFDGRQSLRSLSGGNTTSSLSMLSTPQMPDLPISRSDSPLPWGVTGSSTPRHGGLDQPDFSALATHMRMAAQMLAQLDMSGSKRPRQEVDAIKSKIIASMQSLEEQNFTSEEASEGAVRRATLETIMAATSGPDESMDDDDVPLPEEGTNPEAGAARMENDQKTGGVRRKGDRDDPSAATIGEEWSGKKERIRKTSPYGWMGNWDLLSVIVKTGSDLRQEMFACQLIRICSKVWEDARVPVWVKHMRILVTGESSGLIETITNGLSVHSLKRSLTLASIAAGTNPRKRFATLKDHFTKTFGEETSSTYVAAVEAFKRSLAAYSIIAYILQIKDRHNGNILIDNEGHVVHIDFGFMLSNSPGSVGFEAAPFKLTQDYVDVLGGLTSPAWEGYVQLCKQAFQALRKSPDSIIPVVELMGKESKMDCFQSGVATTAESLRQRLQLRLSEKDAEAFVETDLIGKSLGSYYTRLYDTFQYRTQGIY